MTPRGSSILGRSRTHTKAEPRSSNGPSRCGKTSSKSGCSLTASITGQAREHCGVLRCDGLDDVGAKKQDAVLALDCGASLDQWNPHDRRSRMDARKELAEATKRPPSCKPVAGAVGAPPRTLDGGGHPGTWILRRRLSAPRPVWIHPRGHPRWSN